MSDPVFRVGSVADVFGDPEADSTGTAWGHTDGRPCRADCNGRPIAFVPGWRAPDAFDDNLACGRDPALFPAASLHRNTDHDPILV